MNAPLTYYFIGIGGVGMSALARWCLLKGNHVYGYDLTPSQTTAQLQKEGIQVVFEDSINAIPELAKKNTTLVVFTPAVPKEHPQLNYFIEQGNTVKKRAVFLAECCYGKTTLAVAGTHGKTTTSLFLTHLFEQTQQSFTSFMGGFFNGQPSNLKYTGEDFMLVEADEYDRSFLHLQPTVAGITYVESDHLDVYKTEQAFADAFVQFSKQVSQALVVAHNVPIAGITYGIDVQADYSATAIKPHNEGYTFTLHTPSQTYSNVLINQLGHHNISNALCALAMAEQVGISAAHTLQGLRTFPGVYRRMNTYRWNNRIVIDDYAHHPTEIKSVLATIKDSFPNHSNCVVFQPHLFSRTRDFFDEFVSVLAQFDEVILTPIYPAREQPIEGITSETLLDALPNERKKCIHKKQLKEALKETSASLIAVLGAGDIGAEFETVVSSQSSFAL